ncbi:bacterial regulatory helix-turn-helix, AraC family protein [Lysobacter gummosus]|nr:bacterial regulatory helix-turn-helix, AraC family protein [Lysobacter gummosus]
MRVITPLPACSAAERRRGFQELLDDARQRDAMRMLADPDIDIQRIAAAPGYQEPPSFIRAFQRWTGTTPGQAREALQRRD